MFCPNRDQKNFMTYNLNNLKFLNNFGRYIAYNSNEK